LTVVVDASAIIALIAQETAVDTHVAAAAKVIAPDLAVAEVLNLRWKLHRARMATPTLEGVLAFFDRITLLPSVAFAREADALARKLDHSIYDCLYAVVAQREGARFVTADRRFARKLQGLSIDVVTF